MVKYIDAHCHIYDIPEFSDDGLGGIVCNAVNVADWKRLEQIAKANPNIRVALGIHPWAIENGLPDNWDIMLQDILNQNPAFMVGEIGLDRSRPNLESQMDIFLKQFDIAADLKRVVHLHNVHASSDLLHIFKTHKLPPKIILHGFCENWQVLAKFLKFDNTYVSIGPSILDDKRIGRDSVLAAPLGRILVESDGNTLADTAKIPEIINTVAKLRAQDNNTVADAIYDNTIRAITNG